VPHTTEIGPVNVTVGDAADTGIEFDVEPAITTRYVTIGSTGVRVNEPAPLTTDTVLLDVVHTPSGREYCNDATPLMGEDTATEYVVVVPHTTDDGPDKVTVGDVAATGIEFEVDPAITTRYVTIGSTGVRVNEPAPFVTVTVLADVIHTPSGREYCNAATPLTGEDTATV
jgi:hypothetical protein